MVSYKQQQCLDISFFVDAVLPLPMSDRFHYQGCFGVFTFFYTYTDKARDVWFKFGNFHDLAEKL